MTLTHRSAAVALLAASLAQAAPIAAQSFVPFQFVRVAPRRAPIAPVFAAPMAPVALPLPPVARATPAPCAPMREVELRPGAARWTLAPVSANACAPAASIAQTSTAHETLRVRVTARVAALISSDGGALSLLDESGATTRIRTAAGACGAGTNVGVAVLDPGVYVLRAPGVGVGAAMGVDVEAVPVAQGARVESAGAGSTWLNTATPAPGPYDCLRDDGADVRVLACPGVRATRAALRADRGAVFSLETAATARTCYAVPAAQSQGAQLPAGRLLVVRAWPLGGERGGAAADFI